VDPDRDQTAPPVVRYDRADEVHMTANGRLVIVRPDGTSIVTPPGARVAPASVAREPNRTGSRSARSTDTAPGLPTQR
jgi:hypothetical protein